MSKYMRHFDLLRRFPLKTTGWKNWVQKLLDNQNAPNQPNQSLIQFIEQGDLLEIDTRFCLDCKNTNLFVERLEKDKDTDKDVDADRDRTGRPVGGHWAPQLEEVDINFKGVWIATCSCETSRNVPCSRTREEDRESSSSTRSSSRSATK